MVGRRLTYVDLSLFQIVEGLRYAFPKRMKRFEKKVPLLVALHDRVAKRPRDRRVSRLEAPHPIQPMGHLSLFQGTGSVGCVSAARLMRPHRRVRAERNARPRPARRRFLHRGGVAHCRELAEAGGSSPPADRGRRRIADRDTSCRRCGRAGATNSRSAPASSARARSRRARRAAPAPSSPRTRADSRWRDRAPERAGPSVRSEPNASRFGVVQSACGLHQRVEAAPLRPRPFVAIGAERDVDDPGPHFCDLLRAEAMRRDCAGPIALNENVGVAHQRRERVARAWFAQIERCRQFAAAGVDDERQHRRQMCRGDQQHVGAVRGSVRPHTGPAMMRVRSSTLMPESGRSAAGRGFAGASPICSMVKGGSFAIACPCGCASHSANERHAVTTRPASAAASSSFSAFQPRACAAPRRDRARSRAARATRCNDAADWCAAAPSGRRRSDKGRRCCRDIRPAPCR